MVGDILILAESGMKPFEEVKKTGQASFLENLGQDGETWDVVTRYF